MPLRVLIAVDPSEPSQRAVHEGARLALADSGKVKLVHVVNPVSSFIPGTATEHDSAADGVAKVFVTDLRRRIKGDVAVEEEILHGVPAEQIVAEARKWDADLVVVGHHNRHILSRFALGSVADAVVRHAPCSVLVVRAKDRDESLGCSATLAETA